MTTDPAAPHAARPSRFTTVLYAAAVLLGALALGVRVVNGVRTGHVDWLAMTAPAAVLLGLTGIMVGPRRPVLYYPLLAAGFALIVASYVIPRHRAPRLPPGSATAPAPEQSAREGAPR